MKKITGFIITAGHLDIEWYQPLRSYRFWTIEAIEDLKKAAQRSLIFPHITWSSLVLVISILCKEHYQHELTLSSSTLLLSGHLKAAFVIASDLVPGIPSS